MKTNIIYLMGAGRSGTTALATFLGNNSDVLAIGEMHQFLEHIEEAKSCSCGEILCSCTFWSKVLENLPKDFIEDIAKHRIFCEQFEYHSSIFKYSLNRFSSLDIGQYLYINEMIFNAIKQHNKERYFLDSAKYIGRALGLRKSNNLNIKIIYMIRDVRGVINSFSKNVQSSRGPLSTIFYYLVINTIAEVAYRLLPKGQVVKLKYEDFIENPLDELIKLEGFLDLDLSDIKYKIKNNEPFEMSHIIGGNRLKSEKEIYFKRDNSWQANFSSFKLVIYYLLASPIMLLNRFKI